MHSWRYLLALIFWITVTLRCSSSEDDVISYNDNYFSCPAQCDCFNYYQTVDCSRRGLLAVPALSNVVRRLYLEGNELEELSGRSLDSATNLTVLILENNRIVWIRSDSFCAQQQLQELDLSSNLISAFSISAGLVQSGRSLTVSGPGSGSDIESGPDTGTTATNTSQECRAVNLRELNLSHNLLRSIPANLSYFAPRLEVLNLAYNEITSARLDPSYADMTVLRYLDLSRNDIRHLAANDLDAIRRVPVETINLSDCGIVYIDEFAFHDMEMLSSLVLSRSLLNSSNLEKVFQRFPTDNQMSRLDISETYMNGLTVAMAGMFPKLVGLFASYCDLEWIEPGLFGHFQELETLQLEGGQLSALENIVALKKLRVLSLHMNHLSDLDSRGLYSLETLDLSYNHFESLRSGWISGMDTLQTLNFSHNKISAIKPDAFSLISSVTSLDLSLQPAGRVSTFRNVEDLQTGRIWGTA